MQANFCYMSLNLETRVDKNAKQDEQQNKADDIGKKWAFFHLIETHFRFVLDLFIENLFSSFLQKFVRKNEEIKSKRMSVTDTSTLTSNVLDSSTNRLKQFSESFVSIQIEKVILNDSTIQENFCFYFYF